MYNKKIKLIAGFLLCIGLSGLHAQETILTTGGKASGNGGTVSYSFGQVVYTTNINSNGSVAQGVQQPYEILVIIEVAEASDIILNFSVFPNPTDKNLTLKINGSTRLSIESMSYQLLDFNGKNLRSQNITDVETKIDMEGYVPAVYILNVFEKNKILKSFKIIKN